VTLPVLAPVAVGVKVTEIMQLPPALTEAPHVLVSAKSPLAVMLVMVRVCVPELVKVTIFAALVVVTFSPPKSKLVALRVTATGAVTSVVASAVLFAASTFPALSVAML
jgi:hypothetical protein